GLMRRASKTEIWSCLEATFSETSSLAKARMSPVFGSIAQRNSRAGPTAFLAADSNASSTALTRTSLLMPFSRSQYSSIAKNSAFIHTSQVFPRGEQKSRQNLISDFGALADQQYSTSVGSLRNRAWCVKSKPRHLGRCFQRAQIA